MVARTAEQPSIEGRDVRRCRRVDALPEALRAGAELRASPGNRVALQALVEFFECEHAAIFHHAGGELRAGQVVTRDAGAGMPGLAAMREVAARVLVEQARVQRRVSQQPADARQGWFIAAPLWSGERVAGAVAVGPVLDGSLLDDVFVLDLVAIHAGAHLSQDARYDAERRALASAQAQERRFHELADEPDGSFLWEAEPGTGHITFVSRRAEEILGYPVRSWLSDPAFLATHAHPDDTEQLRRSVGELTAPGQRRVIEHRLVRKDGRSIWFHTGVELVGDVDAPNLRLRGLCVDITQEKLSDEALRLLADVTTILSGSLEYEPTLEALARLLVPRLADWCIIDEVLDSGAVRQIAACAEGPGQELAEELRRFRAIYRGGPSGVARVVRTARPLIYSDVADERVMARALGAAHPEILRELGARSAMIVPLVARGRVRGSMGLVFAASGRRYEARHLAIAVDVAHRAALCVDNARLFEQTRVALRSREEVLAVVSHDLRNPLASIDLAAAHILRMSPPNAPSEAVRKAVERIERSAKHMATMIADLLELAHIELGQLVLDVLPHPVNAIVTEAVEMMASIGAAKDVAVEPVLDERNAVALCDRGRVLQVLSNILGNAIKFSPCGEPVVVRAGSDEHRIVVTVEDHGPGIPDEQLPRIFDRYFRGNATAGGFGMGLAIAKGIVDAHGGALWAERKPDQGTIFSFTLPVRG